MNELDDSELWMSTDSESDEIEDYESISEDATYFTMDMRPQGQSGGFHVRNRRGETLRSVATQYHSGSRRKPAFNVGAIAKAIIYGTLDQDSHTPATLLVYDFSFFSHRSTRIKEANISFEFQAKKGSASIGPTVTKVAPFGKHVMMQTTETVTKTVGGEGGVSGGAVVNVNTNLRAERSVEKVTTHAAKVVGNNPCDEWSNYPIAQWSLQENESQQNGIMTLFRACVLLTRDTEEDFELLPDVQVTPDLKTRLGSIMAFRRSDDPIILAPASEPLNALANDLVQKRWNLGQVDLSNIFYPSRKFGASLVVYSSRPNMEFDFTDDEFHELDVLQVQNHAVDNPKATYEESDVEKEWKSLELDLQCLDVLDLLIDKKRRWDSTECDEETPLLEDYKKKTIASRRDYRDRVAPTALHIFAKSKRDFSRLLRTFRPILLATF
ncbi:hypothetical protein CGMCC3_g550 [Colletotrichum fructicola]|nr:uncharacterized protein CGMCC3_g550 [Colletotrichum fructicola]KAE9583471.1 hypothetical protein CGMCC3_g550 [Colletotrichum fructicola]